MFAGFRTSFHWTLSHQANVSRIIALSLMRVNMNSTTANNADPFLAKSLSPSTTPTRIGTRVPILVFKWTMSPMFNLISNMFEYLELFFFVSSHLNVLHFTISHKEGIYVVQTCVYGNVFLQNKCILSDLMLLHMNSRFELQILYLLKVLKQTYWKYNLP